MFGLNRIRYLNVLTTLEDIFFYDFSAKGTTLLCVYNTNACAHAQAELHAHWKL